jgi:hypothetical protein
MIATVVKFDIDVYSSKTKLTIITSCFTSAILNKPFYILCNVVVELYEWVD